MTPAHGDIVCFSHLRWDFVWQRPQHLMTRFARGCRVLYIEEPVHTDGPTVLHVRPGTGGVEIAVPHVSSTLSRSESAHAQRAVLAEYVTGWKPRDTTAWYYTPLAAAFGDSVPASRIVYDCMDELSLFMGADPDLRWWETHLLQRADVVFTGGHSLFEAKRPLHPRVYRFPSSVDVEHFARARFALADPLDQRHVGKPRCGYFGVIDERLDVELLGGLARLRPDWQFVIVGPVVKIDRGILPVASNLHYLGPKPYAELPAYLSGWDVALVPFALNDATRFVSPTKVPEYLAGGRPVVSTPIADIVREFAGDALVEIASDARGFAVAIETLLESKKNRQVWRERVDRWLGATSWDMTWAAMAGCLDAVDRSGARAGSVEAGRQASRG